MTHRKRLALAAPVLAAVLALSACGGGAPTPASATSATPVTTTVPGTRLTVTAPSDWEQQTKKSSLLLISEKASGTPQYMANVVLTTAPTDGKSLADAGAKMSAEAKAIDGWKADTKDQGASVLAHTQSYRISGTYTSHGIRVAQQEQVIQVAASAGTAKRFVYVTGAWAIGDDAAHKQVASIIQSLVQPAS